MGVIDRECDKEEYGLETEDPRLQTRGGREGSRLRTAGFGLSATDWGLVDDLELRTRKLENCVMSRAQKHRFEGKEYESTRS